MSFDWILVSEGSAWLGADRPAEGPPQLIDIPSFHICRYAVTNDEFKCFLDANGYGRPELWSPQGLLWLQSQHVTEPAFWKDSLFNSAKQPVTGISFYEADAYARWVGASLPYELEWEKAARGNNGATYPWGEEEPDLTRANFAPDFVPVHRTPVPVHHCPNGDSPYGCRQMAGNLYEWCVDPFHVDTPSQRHRSVLGDHRPSCRRVLKGGAWTTGASRLRASARWSAPPGLRDNILGMRLAKRAGESPELGGEG